MYASASLPEELMLNETEGLQEEEMPKQEFFSKQIKPY